MPVSNQCHYGFHSFPFVDWFCLFIYLWVLTFPLLDCSEFGNFVITLIYYNNTRNCCHWAFEYQPSDNQQPVDTTFEYQPSDDQQAVDTTFEYQPSDDQQAVDTTFDNDIDEHDLVMSAAQYDNLVDSIKRGQTELHPLSDTTNIPAVASVDNTYGNNLKRPIDFNNCQVTIQMISWTF